MKINTVTIIGAFPKIFGKLADETIVKYKLDEARYLDNLVSISVINYENAKRNPKAQKRKWFMNKDQASSRGTGTNIIQGKKIGEHSIIGAGSVVVRDIPARCTAVGAPAMPIKFHDSKNGSAKA